MNNLKTIFLCLVLIFPTLSSAQSKIEKVEDKLSGGGSSGSTSTGGISTDSDGDDSFAGAFFQFLFETTFSNLPLLFYFEKLTPDENSIYYNPYPYFQDGFASGNGLRNTMSYKPFALNVDLDLSTFPFALVDENFGASAKLSYDYWALDTSFRLWDEKGAPKRMYQFSIAVERKMRYFPQSEAGFQFGYQQLKIGNILLKGQTLGFDTDYYWFKPISGHFNIHALIFEHSYATLLQTGLRYHFKHSSVLLNYQSLDYIGIVFKGFNIGYSIYF